MNEHLQIKQKIIFGLLVLFLLSLFFFCSFGRYETDFFWIIKGGEWILNNHQIPHQDIWSYSMPTYPWVFHEWASGIIMHLIYTKAGGWGLSLLTSILVTWAILLNNSKKIIVKYYLVFIFFSSLINCYIWIFRPQVFSFLGVSLVFYFLTNYFKTKKIKYLIFLPLIFLVWANLHGGFFIGLCLFFYLFILKTLQKKDFLKNFLFFEPLKKKNLIILLSFFLISVCATLINPYGIHLYREVLLTFYAPLACVGEWLPNNNFLMGIPIVLFVPITLFVFRKIPFEIISVAYIGIFSIFFQKFIPIFLILAIVPFCLALEEFVKIKGIEKITNLLNRFKYGFYFLFIVIILVFTQLIVASKATFPVNAVKYLNQNEPPGKRMYNEYGWGGYLIYHYPEQKVFADGRMSSWVTKDAYFAKDDLKSIMRVNRNYQQTIKKYNIDWMIFDPNKNKLLLSYLKMNNEWVEIYKDDISVIYKKK